MSVQHMQRGFFLFALIGVAILALLPWVLSRRAFPNEPFDVTVVYRDLGGDIQYFPLVTQLARGTLTEQSIRESSGSALRSFPFLTLSPHAVCFALFGAYGYPLADLVVSELYFLLVLLFLRTLRVSAVPSTAVAFLLAWNVPCNLSTHLGLGPLEIDFPLVGVIWGKRIPRPFVSEVFMLLMLVAVTHFLVTKKPGRAIPWLAVAGAFGLLLQGDVHSAIIFAFSGPVLLGVVKRAGLRRSLANLLAAGMLFVVIISPFLAQRLLEHPDIPVRWGVFEVPRLAGLQEHWRNMAEPALAVALISLLAWDMTRRRTGRVYFGAPSSLTRVAVYFAVLLIVAFSSIPLSILFLGKSLQTSHFINRATIICSYTVIAFAVMWLDRVAAQLLESHERVRRLRRALLILLQASVVALFACFLGFKVFLSKRPLYQDHLRTDFFQHLNELSPSYRRSFTELVRFLDGNVPPDSVLASFDHQVFAWWMTFHRGHWFLVEPFVSTVPDEELETRLAVLCKLLDMPPDEYSEFIQLDYVNTFWLGLDKYQASRWHTYSSLDDYTQEQRRAIRERSSNWNVIIPQCELVRLRRRFEDVTLSELDGRELDVIVLTRGQPERKYAPPSESWKAVFENEIFRVYRRLPHLGGRGY